jgi:glycosyltransferase involved in cell wall biosynthesis
MTHVDVVIDNYNYGRFVGAAISSALAQRGQDVRVIVVDDGSTDSSREVICGFGDRITTVFKDNGGQASALNAGWRAATGDALIFLDADDILLPDTARRIRQELADRPDVAKLQYRMEVIDASGSPTGELKPPPHLPMPEGDLRRAELMYPFDLTWLPTSGNAFPSWVLDRLLPIPEEDYSLVADSYLQHLAPLLGPVISTSWVGAQYRVHGSNKYETAGRELDLAHVRQTVQYSAATRRHLLRVADELGLAAPAEIFSVADLAHRMASCKLEPDHHPLEEDSVRALARGGWRATARRDNASIPLRAAFAAWFTAMAVAPAPLARRLAALFLVPERRPGINRILARARRRTR